MPLFLSWYYVFFEYPLSEQSIYPSSKLRLQFLPPVRVAYMTLGREEKQKLFHP
jgi:hypothetical protein